MCVVCVHLSVNVCVCVCGCILLLLTQQISSFLSFFLRYCLHMHLMGSCPDCRFKGNAVEYGMQVRDLTSLYILFTVSVANHVHCNLTPSH